MCNVRLQILRNHGPVDFYGLSVDKGMGVDMVILSPDMVHGDDT